MDNIDQEIIETGEYIKDSTNEQPEMTEKTIENKEENV